jgi:hypothetical protein
MRAKGSKWYLITQIDTNGSLRKQMGKIGVNET